MLILFFMATFFCILDVTCFVWCFKFENQKDRRLIGFFLGGGKRSLLLYTTPNHSSVLPLGYPYSRQGSVPLWTPDLPLFMFWAHLNLISRVRRCLFHTSLRDSLTAVTCAASAHYGLHCQKGGDSLAILKWWQTLSSLFKDGSCSSTHTEGEPALCSFDLVLQTSFPGLRLPTRPGQPSHSNCFSCGIYEEDLIATSAQTAEFSLLFNHIFLRGDLTASWLYSVWRMHAM